MKIGKFVDVNQNNLEITFKIMKNTWKFTFKKTWKSQNKFVRPEKWEPCLMAIVSDNNGHELKYFRLNRP